MAAILNGVWTNQIHFRIGPPYSCKVC